MPAKLIPNDKLTSRKFVTVTGTNYRNFVKSMWNDKITEKQCGKYIAYKSKYWLTGKLGYSLLVTADENNPMVLVVSYTIKHDKEDLPRHGMTLFYRFCSGWTKELDIELPMVMPNSKEAMREQARVLSILKRLSYLHYFNSDDYKKILKELDCR